MTSVPVFAPTVTDCSLDFFVIILITPLSASAPYWAEAAPLTISMRSTLDKFILSKSKAPLVIDEYSFDILLPSNNTKAPAFFPRTINLWPAPIWETSTFVANFKAE